MDSRTLAGLWTFKDTWGFPAIPPEDARLAYAKALIICAHGDNFLAPEEREWIVGYFAALGYADEHLKEIQEFNPVDDRKSLHDIVHSTAVTSHPESKMGLLFDAIRAAEADGPLDEGELAVIKYMAEELGVPAAQIDTIKEHYEMELQARQARIKACFPSGMPF
jgi:hypothetical protein